ASPRNIRFGRIQPIGQNLYLVIDPMRGGAWLWDLGRGKEPEELNPATESTPAGISAATVDEKRQRLIAVVGPSGPRGRGASAAASRKLMALDLKTFEWSELSTFTGPAENLCYSSSDDR